MSVFPYFFSLYNSMSWSRISKSRITNYIWVHYDISDLHWVSRRWRGCSRSCSWPASGSKRTGCWCTSNLNKIPMKVWNFTSVQNPWRLSSYITRISLIDTILFNYRKCSTVRYIMRDSPRVWSNSPRVWNNASRIWSSPRVWSEFGRETTPPSHTTYHVIDTIYK